MPWERLAKDPHAKTAKEKRDEIKIALLKGENVHITLDREVFFKTNGLD